MMNRDERLRERFLQKEEERLLQKEQKRIKEEKYRLYNHCKKIIVQRYVHMLFIYSCETCYERRMMWVEKGLEEACNPLLKEKSGLHHKPTPFVISCPRCGGFMQHMATPLYLEEFAPAKVGDDLFINDKDCDCGKAVFCWDGR